MKPFEARRGDGCVQAGEYHNVWSDSLVNDLRGNIRCLKLSYFSVVRDNRRLMSEGVLGRVHGPIVDLGSKPIIVVELDTVNGS